MVELFLLLVFVAFLFINNKLAKLHAAVAKFEELKKAL